MFLVGNLAKPLTSGPPDYYLGNDYRFEDNESLWTVGSKTYAAEAIRKVEEKVGTLKKARSAAGSQLGPLDKIITVIESVVRYGMGEAPVNAIALALANLFGYAAGFAAASVIPGLGQSGIFNMLIYLQKRCAT